MAFIVAENSVAHIRTVMLGMIPRKISGLEHSLIAVERQRENYIAISC